MTRLELLEIAKPILFSTEMVRAIQRGDKAVTRRPIKVNTAFPKALKPVENPVGLMMVGGIIRPKYQVGDYLYVRETWCKYSKLEDDLATPIEGTEKYYYRADGENPTDFNTFLVQKGGYDEYSNYPKWKSSIHMPQEAARIFLRVTDVRVERLQDITSEQICQEGIICEEPYILNGIEKRYAFQSVWNSTVKKSDLAQYGWDANPWVFVIGFEKLEVE